MAVCYNKLWEKLVDRKMKKKDLLAASDISRGTIARLGQDEKKSIAIICYALNCDIMEILLEDN